MISLIVVLLAFDLSSNEKISSTLGPAQQVTYHGSVTMQDSDREMTLFALSHGYSDYDKAQLNGQLQDSEAIAGILQTFFFNDVQIL